MKKYSVGIVVTSILLCFSAALAFEFSWSGFGFGRGGSQRFIDLLPSLSAWSPSSKAFGNTSTGVVKRQSFTVTNSGNTYAEDVAISVTGAGFSLYSSQTFGNISASRTLTAKVRFSPTAAQAYSGFINYSAPNTAKVSAALSGTGVEAEVSATTFDFEETGAPTGWETFAVSGDGATNYDNATSPLAGAQSLSLATTNGSAGSNYTLPASATVQYVSWMFRTTALPGFSIQFARLRNVGDTPILDVQITDNGSILLYQGSTTSTWSSGIAVNTTIYLQVLYNSNGTGTLWSSTDGTTWTQRITFTNGTASTAATQMYLYNGFQATSTLKFDQVKFSDSFITDGR